MKNILIFIIIILLTGTIPGCNKNRDEKAFLSSLRDSVSLSPDVVVLVPRTGCGGCITYTEEFIEKNVKDSRILFVLGNIVSERLLRERIGNIQNNTNVIVLNSSDQLFGRIIKQYPRIIYLNNWKIKKIEDQSPDNNAIDHLKKYLKDLQVKNIQTIHLDKCLKAPDDIELYENILLLKNIVQLDSVEILNNPNFLLVNSSRFYLKANGKIYLFDHGGKMRGRIGKIGRGPKEYSGIVDFIIIKDSCYILSNFGKKLSVYTTANKFLYSHDLYGGALEMQNSIDNRYIFLFNNANLISRDNEKPRLIDVFSVSQHKIIKSLDYKKKETGHEKVNMFIAPVSYVYDKKVLFKDYLNDTIKMITSDFNYVPYMVISAGKHTAPVKVLENIKYRNEQKKYFTNIAFRESKKYFFIDFYFRDKKIYTIYNKNTNKFLLALQITIEGLSEKEKTEMENKMKYIETLWPSYISNNISYKLFDAFYVPDSIRRRYMINPNGNPCIIISGIN